MTLSLKRISHWTHLTVAVRHALPHLPSVAAAAAATLGAFLLLGWTVARLSWIGANAWIRWIVSSPGVAPLQPDAAACFVLLGLALHAAATRRGRIALVSAMAVDLFAALVFAQHLLAASVEPDSLVSRPTAGPLIGWMAPNTAFAFVCAGTGILVASRHRLLAAFFAAVVFSVGMVALAGYLFGVPAAFAWKRAAHMALLTSAGLALVGAGLMAHAFEQQRRAGKSRRGWAPLLVGLTAALFGVFFSEALRVQENEQIARSVAATARAVGGELRSRFDAMSRALDTLADALSKEDTTHDTWPALTRLATGALSGFERLEAIRSDDDVRPYVLTEMTPPRRTSVMSGEDEQKLASALRVAKTYQQPLFAGPFHTEGEDTAFRVIVPVRQEGGPAFISGSFSARDAFADLSKRLAPGYATEILCEGARVFGTGTGRSAAANEWTEELVLSDTGPLRWALRIWPDEGALRAEQSAFPELMLSAALLIALLLALTVHFETLATDRAQRFEKAVRERTAELERTTARLRWENAERRRTADTLRRSQAVSRSVSGELDLANVVQAVIDAAPALTGAQAGVFFYSFAEADPSAPLRYALSRAAVGHSVNRVLPGHTRVLRRTFDGRTVVRCADVRKDPALAEAAPGYGFPPSYPFVVRSCLAVPVLSRSGEVWGGIFLSHSHTGVFTAQEEEIAIGLAAQASIAMENARLYAAARAAHAEAQAANRAKDRFIAILGHELRNPLGSIRNAYEVLSRRPDDGDLRTRMEAIAGRQLVHLSKLVDDLLDVSRVAPGKVALQRETIDVAALVREHLESEWSTAPGSGISLRIELPTEPVWISGDPTRLVQVIGNLLANALKFTDEGGEVRVSLRVEGKEALLSIADSGAGIAPDKIDYIFQPFAQTDESLDRTMGGLGLGLPIVKGLVEAHGGSVSASSPGLGAGSEFVVRLPLASEPVPVQADAVPAPVAPLRVLIIDDHVDSAEGLAELLTVYGHAARLAHSGPDGIRAARTQHPDIVICDIGLPGIDGYEVARTLRRDPATAHTCLVALTGYGDPSSARRAREAGFDLHLTKPLDATVLRHVLAATADPARPGAH